MRRAGWLDIILACDATVAKTPSLGSMGRRVLDRFFFLLGCGQGPKRHYVTPLHPAHLASVRESAQVATRPKSLAAQRFRGPTGCGRRRRSLELTCPSDSVTALTRRRDIFLNAVPALQNAFKGTPPDFAHPC